MSKTTVITAIEERTAAYARMADQLWKNPELSYQEKESSLLQKKYLREAGFRVTELDHIQNYAFIAEFGSGAPVIGLLGEFDALPGLSQKVQGTQEAVVEGAPGHACGHNLLGTACLAAAEGVKKALEKGELHGTVRYFGCPAEEQLGKPKLAAAGVFNGLDSIISWHPSDINTVAAYGTNASVELEFSFHGQPAHAAQVPHLGRSALDALTLMSIGVEFLREHMPTSARVHYIVTAGGERPNIVPKYAAGEYQVRSPRMREALSLLTRVIDVAKGAAMMTGTRLEYHVKYGCWDVMPNKVISDALWENLKGIPNPTWTPEELKLAAEINSLFNDDQKRATLMGLGVDTASADELVKQALHEGVGYWGIGWTIPASTDVGDASHIAPTAQINTATSPIGVGAHTWQATAANGSTFAIKGMIYAAKVMGATAYDLMTKPDVLAAAQAEFKKATAGETYAAAENLVREIQEADSVNAK
ncbi:MAG: amidohydrolase [Treponemataceae bacterium]